MRSLALLLALLLGCRGDTAPARGAPAITVSVEYPGASPETIETAVVIPIERSLAKVPGLRALESRIATDNATVLIELASTADLDRAHKEIQHELVQLLSELPRDLRPPAVRRTRSDDQPILWLALGSDGALPIGELSRYANEQIVPRLERTSGVDAVERHGVADLSFIVRPDLERLAAYRLAMFDVLAALQAIEVSKPEQLGEIVVKLVDGAPVRISDVATIEAGFERSPGPPTLAVRARVTAAPAEVLRDVRDVIAKLQPELPPGVTVTETKSPTTPRSGGLAVTVTGPDLDQLDAIANGYVTALKKHGLGDVVRDPPPGEPEQIAVPDPAAATRLGVPLADVLATLRVVGSMRVGSMIVAGAHHPVVVKLPPTTTLPAALDLLSVKNHDGVLVRLSEIVTVRTGIAREIVRRNRERVITLSIVVGGSQRAVAKKLIAEHPLPVGYRVTVTVER